VPNRKRAGDEAQSDEDNHAPDKGRRLGDAQNHGAEVNRQNAQDGESDSSRDEIDDREAPPGIPEGAGSGDDHGERKGRRSETTDGDGHAGTVADGLLEPVEFFFARDLADAFLAEFAGDTGQQEGSHGGAASGGKHVDEKSSMMVRDQADNQEIVSKREHEEGRIQNSQDEGPKIAKVEQEVKQRAKAMGHRTLFQGMESRTGCKLIRFQPRAEGCSVLSFYLGAG
jgi:hypothetical protein